MAEVTFRDFAGAIMGGDTARAAEVLQTLLGLEASAATTAATHFQTSMTADPAFMSKAMGLRTAVTGGTDHEIASLLHLSPVIVGAEKFLPVPNEGADGARKARLRADGDHSVGRARRRRRLLGGTGFALRRLDLQLIGRRLVVLRRCVDHARGQHQGDDK